MMLSLILSLSSDSVAFQLQCEIAWSCQAAQPLFEEMVAGFLPLRPDQ